MPSPLIESKHPRIFSLYCLISWIWPFSFSVTVFANLCITSSSYSFDVGMSLLSLIALHTHGDLVVNNIHEICFNYYNALRCCVSRNYVHTSMPSKSPK